MQNNQIWKFGCFLFFIGAVSSTYVPCDDCVDYANTNDLKKISLRFYAAGGSNDVYATVLAEDAIELLNEMDTSLNTVLYISGWTESPDSESVSAIVDAYLDRGDHNILIADYSEIASNKWAYVAASANGVGHTLAQSLNKLVSGGLDSTKLHIVGFSLGGQVSGFIGRYVDFEIPRITGLDPAGPSFGSDKEHLCADDAKFVDIIHTSAGVFGTDYSSGTADFWPNGGVSTQPGCEGSEKMAADTCSHAKAWAYYVESLIHENGFHSVQCDAYSFFMLGLCRSGSQAQMGFMVDTATASGNYGLQTNSEYPYGREESGMSYSE